MYRPAKRLRAADTGASMGLNAILSSSPALHHLSSFITSSDVGRLGMTCRGYRAVISGDWSGTSISRGTAGIVIDRYTASPHIKLPLAYCGLEERKGVYYWVPSSACLRERRVGYSLQHVELSASFNRLSPQKQLQLLWSCNFVHTLTVESSFFQCPCPVCESVARPTAFIPSVRDAAVGRMEDIAISHLPAARDQQSQSPPQDQVQTRDNTEAPAVFASLWVGASPTGSASPSPLAVSPSGSSPPSTGQQPHSPLIATVDEFLSVNASSAQAGLGLGQMKKEKQSPAVTVASIPMALRKDVAILHAFDRLTLVFQLAYRNRATLTRMNIEGPVSSLSTALMRDDDLPKLPFPLKPKVPVTSAKPSLKTPPLFSKLEIAAFGSTIDCRYIVPFLDYSDFACLSSVTVGRLTARYTHSVPQFGEKATVVFAPQHIFNQMSFPAAPHLPAIYNGAIDENLRFQGRGIFVCDEYTYEGEFRDGVNNGFGHMKSSAGEMYTGEWKHGQRNGRGRVVQLSGDSLAGNWVHDSLGGLGTLETSEGFCYIGNWLNSRFEGWGSIWYKGRLMCYGRFSRGFLCGWSRTVRVVTNKDPPGITWEEGEHDDHGRVSRCFQITLNIPGREVNGSVNRRFISQLPMTDVAKHRKELIDKGLELMNSPTAPARADNLPLQKPVASPPLMKHFVHDFPDDDSPFADEDDDPVDASPRPFAPVASTELCMSPAARRPLAQLSVSPADFVTPTLRLNSLSSSLEAQDSPPNALDTDNGRNDAPHMTPTSTHLPSRAFTERCWTNSAPRHMSVEVASPANRAETGLRSRMGHRSLGLSQRAAARLAAFSEHLNSTGPRLRTSEALGQQSGSARHQRRLMVTPPEFPEVPARSAPSGNGLSDDVQPPVTIPVHPLNGDMREAVTDPEIDMEDNADPTPDQPEIDPPPAPVEGASRSRPALLQVMETVEMINKFSKGHQDDLWDLFWEWDRLYFKHVHCDWLRYEDGDPLQMRRITSPLHVPAPDEVPTWLRVKLWRYYNYRKLADLDPGVVKGSLAPFVV